MPEGPNPIDQLLAQGGEAWAAFYAANMEVPASMKRRLVENDFVAVSARFEAIYEPDLTRHLDPVQMPCLIYVGEDEPAYGGSQQLAGLLPDAEFIAFPGLNHFDMLASLDVVLPEIRRFLGKIG